VRENAQEIPNAGRRQDRLAGRVPAPSESAAHFAALRSSPAPPFAVLAGLHPRRAHRAVARDTVVLAPPRLWVERQRDSMRPARLRVSMLEVVTQTQPNTGLLLTATFAACAAVPRTCFRDVRSRNPRWVV